MGPAKRTISAARSRGNSAAMTNTNRLGSAQLATRDIHQQVDSTHERLVLGWIDKELADHIEEYQEEAPIVSTQPNRAESPSPDAAAGQETLGFSNDDVEEDKSDTYEEDFWKGSGSVRFGASSKRHVVALTRGSLLALIDDHRHDTSKKHTKEASAGFFAAASAAAAAVGLEDLADNLLHNKSNDVGDGEADEVVSVSSQGSRPHSADGGRPLSAENLARHAAATSGAGYGSAPADWFGAFAEQSAAVFANSSSSKLPRSKSMEPRTASVKLTGPSAKRNLSVKIEDYLDGVMEISEPDDGVPFRTALPVRRKSIGAVDDAVGGSGKSGKVKYFSYLYKSKKKRTKSPSSKNENGTLTAGDSTRASSPPMVDPFEAARPPRPASNPNVRAALSLGTALDDELKPRPVVDLERKYSSPGADGPAWGQIANYSTKPTIRPHSTSRRSTPQAAGGSRHPESGTPTNRPQSTSRGDSPAIVGWVKKFSFEGEYQNSPFLYHMTKDKHKEKYGDAQRQQRVAAERAAAAKEGTTADDVGNKAISPQSSPATKRPVKVAPLKLTSTSTISELPKHSSFDTAVERPKNPFLRQNSWERDPDAPDYSANPSPARKPFTLTRQSTSDSASYAPDFEGSGLDSSSKVSFLSRQNTQQRLSSDVESPASGRALSKQEAFERDIRNGLGLLSRQNSLSASGGGAGRGTLSRQNTMDRPTLARQNTSDRDGRMGQLTRQNSSTLSGQPQPGVQQPLSGVAKGISDLQALINSINSVLIAPAPMRLSRPADIFSRGLNGPLDTSSPLSRSVAQDGESTPPGVGSLSRGNSFKRLPSNPHTARSLASSTSSPLRAGDSLTSIALTNPTIDEATSRPSTRGGVTFAPSVPPSTPPVLSDSIAQYLPSERRGSLSSGDTLGALPVFDGVSAALARRKSVAAIAAENAATSNIDMLVSARRHSHLGALTPVISPQPSYRTQPSQRPMQTSFDSASAVNNPLTDEYYDAEEGLQDTGVIIANLHADPLYRILCEEVERTMTLRSSSPAPTSMLQGKPGQAKRPQSSRDQLHPTHAARPTRSANGLSNYKTRHLGPVMSPPDLKVLGSFISLPPAAWVTCRVVYFLLMSFYECVPRVGRHYEYRTYMNAEPLWEALEAQIAERQLCMEEVELQYSWPLMQSILTRFPVLTAKVLQIVEWGIPETDGLDGRAKSPQFLPSIFFEAFPPTKLIYLRDLIKQSMGLFQSSELLLVVPVCSQLCDWSKRVIAQVYASCISRLRATQSNTNKVNAVLHSTVPLHVPAEEDDRELSVWEQKEPTPPALLPPNLKFAIAIEDALEETSLFGMHSIDSYTALQESHGAPLFRVSISRTLEKGLNLVKPSDHLDLLLVTPSFTDVSIQIGAAQAGGHFDEFGSQVHSLDDDSSLQKLQRDWLLAKLNYERHLQQFAASPLHRVVLLPPCNPPSEDTFFSSEQSQHEQDLQRRIESYVNEQNGQQLRGYNQVDSARRSLQSKGVHPVLQHCLTSAGNGAHFLPTNGHVGNKTEADVLVTRLRDGRLPGLLPRQNSKDDDSEP
jgi:hypothetical protein